MSRVFIAAYCRKRELLPATLFVFDTLRVGFPTAEVWLDLTLPPTPWRKEAENQIRDVAANCNVAMVEDRRSEERWRWIHDLVQCNDDDFWLCDTDIAFWDKVEHWTFQAPLAGRYVPEFRCDFTKSITAARLHPSLMWIDPKRVRAEMERYYAGIPMTPYTPRPNLFREQFIPKKITVPASPGGPFFPFGHWQVENTFYDTCALLHNAVFSQPFSDEQNLAFDHIHCATISDIVGPHISDGQMEARHRAIFENPQLLKGAWQRDREFYDARKPVAA